jgi:hypothetical protein
MPDESKRNAIKILGRIIAERESFWERYLCCNLIKILRYSEMKNRRENLADWCLWKCVFHAHPDFETIYQAIANYL